MWDDLLRAYDSAVAGKFSPVTTTVAGVPRSLVTVPGIVAPVALGVGMPEDWYAKAGRPFIAITRDGMVPDLTRVQPAFRAAEVSTNPATPNTINIQKDPPQPVNFLYTVEIQAETMGAFNALAMFVMLTALPFTGFGTALTVAGMDISYRGAGGKDLTDYTTKEGRLFRMVFSYTVEGWLYTLDCIKVPQILHVDIALETHPDASTFTTPEADEITHITFDAPVTP